ncbi:MAG: cobalt-precorrin-6A reductase [Propionicimonas sp.]|nr:cobalt-precorrin-6A reductase [Propionicimonas sp.]
MTVLVLGGTGESRQLAELLAQAGVSAVTSLAGVVRTRELPVGEVRTGGFGGVAGLAGYLNAESVSAVVDATHPFAARITAHAAAACAQTGTPLLRLSRPGWRRRPDSSDWHWVTDLAAARRAAEGLGRRVFLSTGRQGVPAFTDWDDRYVLLRVVEDPEVAVPETWEVLYARGPFDFADELELMRDRRIDVLVTKDSGGGHTAAKLDAAAELGVPVVVVARPPDPAGVERVDSAEAAAEWVLSLR